MTFQNSAATPAVVKVLNLPVPPTLSPGGLSDDPLQLLHLHIHLLIIGLPGINLGHGEEGGVGAHVGAEEVTVRAQADHRCPQVPGEEKSETPGEHGSVSYDAVPPNLLKVKVNVLLYHLNQHCALLLKLLWKYAS